MDDNRRKSNGAWYPARSTEAENGSHDESENDEPNDEPNDELVEYSSYTWDQYNHTQTGGSSSSRVEDLYRRNMDYPYPEDPSAPRSMLNFDTADVFQRLSAYGSGANLRSNPSDEYPRYSRAAIEGYDRAFSTTVDSQSISDSYYYGQLSTDEESDEGPHEAQEASTCDNAAGNNNYNVGEENDNDNDNDNEPRQTKARKDKKGKKKERKRR